jgi:uncharacterized protein YcbX
LYQITQLYIYPVKSLGGIALKESRLEARGLQHDRRWMLCDENNQFITQRKFAHLALFKLQLIDSGFQIEFQGNYIQIPYSINGDRIQVKVWEDTCDAIEYPEASDWFTKMLSITCKLCYMPHDTKRIVDEKYAGSNQINSFSDGFPILIAGQQSLDFLNQKLKQPIDINRFRPNMVFDGGSAYDEDSFSMFSINDVLFKGVKPCARCQVIGIDQNTSTVNLEPLSVLSSYRNVNNKVLFGQNVIVLQEDGLIKVGNQIILH